MAALVTLRELQLNDAQIDDEGMDHLAALTELEVLNISGTRITDAGLQKLQPLGRLRNIYPAFPR